MHSCGNVEGQTSWGLRGTVSTPAGYGAAPRSKQYVSKMTHGFFITINSMILYFKHIIHIDDFLLNGHIFASLFFPPHFSTFLVACPWQIVSSCLIKCSMSFMIYWFVLSICIIFWEPKTVWYHFHLCIRCSLLKPTTRILQLWLTFTVSV